MTKRIKLKLFSPPPNESRTVFVTYDKDTKGIELETYTCGNCEFVLAENIIANTYNDIVFQCLLANLKMR